MPIFKNRMDAGNKLFEKLKSFKPSKCIVFSLVRGGVVVGDIFAQKLSCPHLPLVVTKISAPAQPELAIGALCFDISYLERHIVATLGLSKAEIRAQIAASQKKFNRYVEIFNVKEELYDTVRGKVAIIVDDGIATGASMKVSYLFIASKQPKKIVVGAPVAPTDFELQGPDVVILHKTSTFASVSQFYEDFPQVTDEEVKQILSRQ